MIKRDVRFYFIKWFATRAAVTLTACVYHLYHMMVCSRLGDGITSVCVHLCILTDCKCVKAGLNVRWNVTVLLLHVFKTSIKMLYFTFHDYIVSIMSESMFICWMIKSLFMLTCDFHSLCDSYIELHSIDWLLNINTMQCH